MSDIFMPFCRFYGEVFLMNKEELRIIEKQIGHTFKNKQLLIQAFTRRSFSQENGGGDNEVLEFIGDKVLDYVVVKLLAELYGFISKKADNIGEYCNDYSENELTEMKRKLVEGDTLANRIDLLGISEYLRLGKGDRKKKLYNNKSVKEDLFEAIVAAVAIDTNWSIAKMEEVVENMLDPLYYISDKVEWQSVTIVQQWARKKYNTTAIFECRSVYNTPFLRNMNWIQSTTSGRINNDCLITVKGFDYVFRGFGETENEARLDAARIACEYLDRNNLLFTINDEIENPNVQQAINQLETLARRGYFEIPEYKFIESYDKNGNPKWQATCIIEDFEKVFNATSTSKKEAKKNAAFKMLNYVLENNNEE